MVRVVRRDGISIIVYRERGGRHHEPHCHVEWVNGSCSISLLDFRVLGRKTPPRRVWDVVVTELPNIERRWDEPNEEAR